MEKEYLGEYPYISGYSVWKNHNEELVAKIKAIKPIDGLNVGEHIKHWQLGPCRIVNKLNEREYLVFSDQRGIHGIFVVENTEKEIRNDLLMRINKEFSASKYYLENFGVQFKVSEQNKWDESVIVLDLLDDLDVGADYDEVLTYGKLSEQIRYHDLGREIKINIFLGRGSVSCFFDNNGNFVLRDYNYKLTNYSDGTLSTVREESLARMLKLISTEISGKLKYDKSKRVWFNNQTAFKLYEEMGSGGKLGKELTLIFDKLPNQGAAYYHSNNSREGYKPKKSAIEVDVKHLLDYVETKVNEYYAL